MNKRVAAGVRALCWAFVIDVALAMPGYWAVTAKYGRRPFGLTLSEFVVMILFLMLLMLVIGVLLTRLMFMIQHRKF